MPTYDYHCKKCDKTFSVRMGFDAYDRKQMTCKHCKSKRVRQVVPSVSIKTSRKS